MISKSKEHSLSFLIVVQIMMGSFNAFHILEKRFFEHNDTVYILNRLLRNRTAKRTTRPHQ